MEIRTLDEETIPALVDDLWLPFAEEMAELDPYNELAEEGAREHAIDYRHNQLTDDDIVLFVAEIGDELAGYAAAEYTDPAPVFARGAAINLGELYVRPGYRGEGIATALVDHVEAWASDRDAERLKLSVNQRNDGARALYEELGFSVRRLKMDKPL